MIPMTKIEITRGEGPLEGTAYPVGKTFVVSTWASANHILEGIARCKASYPIEAKYPGTYDKTDFKVYFADGETYEGRADVRADGDDTDLAKHIIEFAKFHSGNFKPPHISPEDYARLMTEYEKEGIAKGYRDFLKTYEVPT